MAAGQWVFKRIPTFRKKFDALPPEKQKKCRELFARWKTDPFSQALGVHGINRLTSLLKEPIRAIHVEQNLIVTFAVRKNQIVSLDIGTHREVYGHD